MVLGYEKLIILATTIMPSVLILAAVILSDRFREPLKPILVTFFVGVFLCFPAGLLNSILIWSQDAPENYTFLAGLTEESLKFAAILLFVRNQADFNEPMDAIVYGTLISLGFATLENLEYVFNSKSAAESMQIATIRAITAIPLHACCGVIMGYFFGLYAFSGQRSYLLKSLFLPMLFHAIYNFLATFSSLLTALILIGLIRYAYALHKHFAYLQSGKTREEERENSLNKD